MNLKLKRPIPNINISWTIPLIKSYCHFAELSSALYVLATDSESCLQLINALIDEFHLNSIVNIAENKYSSGRNHLKAFPNEKGFRIFLSTVKSETTHRALSPSSINVYASGTKSDYLVPFICRYEKTGNLFKIYDLHIIHKLIADVTNDIIASNRTSKVPIYILKLYFKYLQSLK